MKPLTAVGLGAIAIVLGTAFVASEGVVNRQAASNRVTVIYWEKWTGSEGEEMRKSVEAFNKSQDRIFVKYLSISDVSGKTMLATAGGDPPDVAGLWASNVVPNADLNAALDLGPMAREAGIKESDYMPVYWKLMTYKGGLWALPSTPATTALHVNVDLVPKQYNTPETFPKTIEGLDKLVDKISKTNPDGSMKLAGFLPAEPGWWHWAWCYYFGGKLADGDNLTLNSPENVRAFDWIAAYTKRFGSKQVQAFQSGFGNFASPQDAFMDGKIASELHGVYKANYIHLYSPKMHWFAVPFPHLADRPDLADMTNADSDVYMIPRGARHPKEAFEFIRYMQRQDVMESICTRHGKNSPLSHVSEGFLKNHPNPYIRLFDRLARSRNALMQPQLGVMPEIGNEISNVFQEIQADQMTPKQALDAAQERMVGRWATYRKQVLGQP